MADPQNLGFTFTCRNQRPRSTRVFTAITDQHVISTYFTDASSGPLAAQERTVHWRFDDLDHRRRRSGRRTRPQPPHRLATGPPPGTSATAPPSPSRSSQTATPPSSTSPKPAGAATPPASTAPSTNAPAGPTSSPASKPASNTTSTSRTFTSMSRHRIAISPVRVASMNPPASCTQVGAPRPPASGRDAPSGRSSETS